MRTSLVLSFALILFSQVIFGQVASNSEIKKENSKNCIFFLLKGPPKSEPDPKPIFEKHKVYIDKLIAEKTIILTGAFTEIGSYSGFMVINESDKAKAIKILENDPGYNKLYSAEAFTWFEPKNLKGN